MSKIVYVRDEDPNLFTFPPAPCFKKHYDVPFFPDDLLINGAWYEEKGIGLRKGFRKLVPAMVFFKDGTILGRKKDGGTRLWFGEKIQQEDIIRYPTIKKLAARTFKTERTRTDVPYDLIGYAVYRKGRVRNEALVVYAATLEKKHMLHGETWLSLQDIPKFYFTLDSLSKVIFDAFYEDRILRNRYFVSQKQDKTVDNKSV